MMPEALIASTHACLCAHEYHHAPEGYTVVGTTVKRPAVPPRWIGAQIDLLGTKLAASRQTAAGAHSGGYVCARCQARGPSAALVNPGSQANLGIFLGPMAGARDRRCDQDGVRRDRTR